MRGKEVSRIEGFSDAVFGFALTLLVVSLEVPTSFAELRHTLEGFPAFAATFAIVCWIWYEHYAYFRRFALQDELTIFLNCILMFVVVFFIYPLKFTFTGLIGQILQIEPMVTTEMTAADGRLLLLVFSAGFVAVFTIFGLLYWNALRRHHQLHLTPLETFDAHAAAKAHLFSVVIGLMSIVLTLTLPINLVGLSGFFYAVLGPVHAFHGWRTGRARKRLEVAT